MTHNTDVLRSGADRLPGAGDVPRRRADWIVGSYFGSGVALADSVVVMLAGLAAFLLCRALGWPVQVAADTMAVLLGVMCAVLVLALALKGAYRPAEIARPWASARASVESILVAAGAAILLTYLMGRAGAMPGRWFLLWVALAAAGLVAFRSVLGPFVSFLTSRGALARRVAILGSGSIAERITDKLDFAAGELNAFAGFFDDRSEDRVRAECALSVAGGVDELLERVRAGQVDVVVVALPWTARERIASILSKLAPYSVTVRLSPDLNGLSLIETERGVSAPVPLLRLAEPPIRGWRSAFKRLEDIVISVAAVTLLSPLMLAVAVLIKLESPGPVLFRQPREGRNRRIFQMLKFRSMYAEGADVRADRLTRPNDPRITRLGRFLRRWSVDELPQFFNVLAGDMSAIGPRPHPPDFHYEGTRFDAVVVDYAHRHRVKPGITGWAQVNGLRGTPPDERAAVQMMQRRTQHDNHYINNWSPRFDLRILWLTLVVVVFRKQAY